MRESDKVDMENVLQTETLANINQDDLLQNLQKERNVKGSNLDVEFSNGGTNSIEMVSQTDCKPTKSYRSYSADEKEAFFSLWYDKIGASVSEIARELNIHPRTAQKWIKEYKESGSELIPISRRGAKSQSGQLGNNQKDHLFKYLKENPEAQLDEMMDSLSDAFDTFKLSKSSLRQFVHDECFFSFSFSKKDSVNRNVLDMMKQQLEFAESILGATDIDYCKNCVFISEADFNISIREWAPKNSPAIEPPPLSVEKRSVLGAVSYQGIVLMSLRKPFASPPNENTELLSEESIPLSKRSRTSQWQQFLMDAMDILDEDPSFKNAYLVVDDTIIGKNTIISSLIVHRGYRCLCLPPRPPELNPMEQVWAMIEGTLKRERLDVGETLTTRVRESANTVPKENIQHCVYESAKFLEKCLNMESS